MKKFSTSKALASTREPNQLAWPIPFLSWWHYPFRFLCTSGVHIWSDSNVPTTC